MLTHTDYARIVGTIVPQVVGNDRGYWDRWKRAREVGRAELVRFMRSVETPTCAFDIHKQTKFLSLQWTRIYLEELAADNEVLVTKVKGCRYYRTAGGAMEGDA
jgi:hypothetical protein